MAVLDLAAVIDREMGIATWQRDNLLLSAVGTTATRFLRQNPNRLAFLFVNLSTVDMFVGWFPNVSASRGMTVGAGGGNLMVWYKEDLHLPGLEWFVIANAANSNLFVSELLIRKGPEGVPDEA